MDVRDTFGFLLGAWALERRLDDHCSGARFLFSGVATVRLLPGGEGGTRNARAAYSELGRIRTGDHEGEATRRLTYERRGGLVAARFEDGRPFVEIDLGAGQCAGVHLCGQDRYEIEFSVLGEDDLEEHWRVEGPDTSYDARATLRRLTAAGRA